MISANDVHYVQDIIRSLLIRKLKRVWGIKWEYE